MHSEASSTASTKAKSSLRSKQTLWYKTNRDQRKPNGGHLQLKHAPNVSNASLIFEHKPPTLSTQDDYPYHYVDLSISTPQRTNTISTPQHTYFSIITRETFEDKHLSRSSYKNNEMTTTCNANEKATQPKRDPAARNFQTLYNATLHIPSYELSVHKCNKSTPDVRKHKRL